jgi:hypothetical protein
MESKPDNIIYVDFHKKPNITCNGDLEGSYGKKIPANPLTPFIEKYYEIKDRISELNYKLSRR